MFARRYWLVIGAALFGLLTFSSIVRAQTATTAAEYWHLVEETIAELGTEIPDTALLESLAADWEAVTVLQLDDGRLQPIDTSSISARLRNAETEWSELEAELAALQAQRDTSSSRDYDQNLTSQALADTLSDTAFNYAEDEPNFLERLWARFVAFILDVVARLFGGMGRFGPTLGSLFTGTLVVVLLILLGLIIRGVLRDFVSEAELAEHLEREKVLTADSALTQAQSHSEDGDFRTAVRYLYLSSLLSLEERGLLRYDRSLTNREYLRSVAHVPELANVLRDVVNIFDRVWYGYQPINAETYNRYAAQVQALRRRG